MVGAVQLGGGPVLGKVNGRAEILSEVFDPIVVVAEPLPPVVEADGVVVGEEAGNKQKNGVREIVLGRNMHTTSLVITEPDANDELTGDKDAYMAGVLARYRKNLIERTKHHLGMRAK